MIRSIVPDPISRQPWGVIVPLFLLVGFGATVLYSAAGNSLQPWALNHALRFLVFLTMALVIARLPRRRFEEFAFPVYGAVLVLLILVEALGYVGKGSQRWLDLGFIRLQPSELMKPAVVLALARYYATLPPALTQSWRSLLPAAGLIGMPAALVMLQPDLGTALMVTAGGLTIMFLSGLPLRWFVGGAAATAVAAPIAFFSLLHEYQRKRVFVFLDPEGDPLGAGYHITQSKIAIGSGGVFGKGFGHGSQSGLGYLPEAHTDFVFATMAEQWGFIGGVLVLAGFMLIFRWGLRVARKSRDRFAMLLAAGMTTTIFFYFCINLMMVMGLAPVVGIPLPFMSHGGSSMMTNMICIGTIMAVARWSRPRGIGMP
ncbi:MAG: rod shape-determining protein RodA [Novosphingobium sp.]